MGGAEQNLLSLVAELPSPGYRHHLAWVKPISEGATEMGPAFAPYMASMIPLYEGARASLPAAPLRLARWLRGSRIDVIHAQLILPQLVARAASIAAGGVPVITTWQNAYYDDDALGGFGDSRRRRAIFRTLDRLSGRSDRHFIGVSEHVARSCADNLGVSMDRVSVVYNSVARSRFAAATPEELDRLRAELGVTAATRVLLSVGRLSEQKRHGDTIDAMPAVLARHPGTLLLIAGRGPLTEQLREQAKARGVADAVRFLGVRGDVAALYQLADVFVFPSRYEGLALALIEALANALPAVVSDIPQNREAALGVEEAVRFVSASEPLAPAIVKALDDRATLRAAALAKVAALRERFSPTRLAAQFASIAEAAARR